MRHVLDGFKVLDFTQVLAGATCTRLLAEMGAEVIKIELPPKGDFSRGFGAFRDGRSAYYIQQNRGKKSVCVDRKSRRVSRFCVLSWRRSTSSSRTSRPV